MLHSESICTCKSAGVPQQRLHTTSRSSACLGASLLEPAWQTKPLPRVVDADSPFACHADSLRASAAQACTALDVDVIAFDLARRLPFRLRPAALSAAVRRGVALELCYTPALRDDAARRNLFGNAAGAWFIWPCMCQILSNGAGCGCMPPQILSSDGLQHVPWLPDRSPTAQAGTLY